MKWWFVFSVVIQLACLGCVSGDNSGSSKVGVSAFYLETEVDSPLLWEEVLNDALSRRVFELYSSHTMLEYSELTRLEGTRIRYKIYRSGTNVVFVGDFPSVGVSTRFVVHEDPLCNRVLILETGVVCIDGNSQSVKDSFEVDVNISENLVKHYFLRAFNPMEVYPFLGEALKKAFAAQAEFCIVAPMIKTDGSVLVYTGNEFWSVELPLITDPENIKLFCEYPAMFIRPFETFPFEDFWESDNLHLDETQYWHSYFSKLLEQVFLKCSFIYLR